MDAVKEGRGEAIEDIELIRALCEVLDSSSSCSMAVSMLGYVRLMVSSEGGLTNAGHWSVM